MNQIVLFFALVERLFSSHRLIFLGHAPCQETAAYRTLNTCADEVVTDLELVLASLVAATLQPGAACRLDVEARSVWAVRLPPYDEHPHERVLVYQVASLIGAHVYIGEANTYTIEVRAPALSLLTRFRSSPAPLPCHHLFRLFCLLSDSLFLPEICIVTDPRVLFRICISVSKITGSTNLRYFICTPPLSLPPSLFSLSLSLSLQSAPLRLPSAAEHASFVAFVARLEALAETPLDGAALGLLLTSHTY